MGVSDKLLTGGETVLAGLLAGFALKDAQETRRRKSSPLCFDDGLTQIEFIALARKVAKSTTRVKDVAVAGMVVTLFVRSSSGLSTWTANIDFNDYGHLTGTYWLTTENSDSLIPGHFADAFKTKIQSRVRGATSERQ